MKKVKSVLLWIVIWAVAVIAFGIGQDINGTVPFTSRPYVAPTK